MVAAAGHEIGSSVAELQDRSPHEMEASTRPVEIAGSNVVRWPKHLPHELDAGTPLIAGAGSSVAR